MSFLTKWLLSVIAVAFLVSIAETLMPDKRVREVGRLVGGLLLLLALLQPLLELGLPDAELSFDAYFAEITEKEQTYQKQQTQSLAEFIKERSEAYIENEAGTLGLSVQAVVEMKLGEDGYPYPAAIQLDIPYHAALAKKITGELGIAEERQTWSTKETG